MLKFKFKERNLSHIVPNAITFANMALGVIAIYLSMGATVDKLKAAAAIILIAGAADKLMVLLPKNWAPLANSARNWTPFATWFPSVLLRYLFGGIWAWIH